MSDLLANLNPEQIKAVQHEAGPVLVLAGAGSGKTKALTQRIAYLHLERKVALDRILAITFTNKAAAEMKERVLHLLGGKSSGQLQVSTFHSFCARLLRREAGKLGFAESFSILDANDSLSAIKKIMERLQIDPKKTYPEAVKNAISSAKNELVDSSEYTRLANGAFQQTVARVYPEYQSYLKTNNSVDFDDLIMLTIKLFREQPEVLAKYQTKFTYIMIDEYQDTNTAQYTLANLLAAKHRNLFVVGDDWQSIYSWRGANFENILNFNRDYPETVVIKLEQNYRSTQTILDAAHAIIEHNRNRSDKHLWTEKEIGPAVTIYEALNDKDEADFIIKTVRELRSEKDISLNDFVILYRTNAQSRGLEEAMLRADMPYRVIGGVKFYDRKEIRDMVAYLTLLANPANDISVERVINVPTRGIGAKTLEAIQETARNSGVSILEYLNSNPDLTGGAREFANIMKDLNDSAGKVSLSKLLDHLLNLTDYKTMLKGEGIEGEGRLENIYELKSVMEKYDHLPTLEALQVFLEEVSLISDADNQDANHEAITMMTIHTAKGLEFEYVFVVGLEENLFPHSRSLFDQNELEEERRLAYVAVTRAKQQVFLIHAKERLIYGSMQNNPRSRFLADIPEELVEEVARYNHHASQGARSNGPAVKSADSFKPGVKVIHQQFGEGTVIAKAGDVITVAFVNEGIKNLIPELAKLEVKR
jgi:DNA helicase-2/ATP-dependent DNA helicase PcrA